MALFKASSKLLNWSIWVETVPINLDSLIYACQVVLEQPTKFGKNYFWPSEVTFGKMRVSLLFDPPLGLKWPFSRRPQGLNGLICVKTVPINLEPLI